MHPSAVKKMVNSHEINGNHSLHEIRHEMWLEEELLHSTTHTLVVGGRHPHPGGGRPPPTPSCPAVGGGRPPPAGPQHKGICLMPSPPGWLGRALTRGIGSLSLWYGSSVQLPVL